MGSYGNTTEPQGFFGIPVGIIISALAKTGKIFMGNFCKGGS